MNYNLLSIIIITLLFLIIGMLIGIVFVPEYSFHGPNAVNFCKQIYYNKKTNKCYKFSIARVKCSTNY